MRELKEEFRKAYDQGAYAEAFRLMCRLWHQSPSPATAAWIIRNAREIPQKLRFEKRKVALLRSYTLEPAVAMLQASSLCESIELEPYLGGFNVIAQELLDPRSGLWQFQPDVTFLSILTRSIAPELWTGDNILDASIRTNVKERVITEYRSMLDAFRHNGTGILIIQGLELPARPRLGIADSGHAQGQFETIRQINSELQQAAAPYANLFYLDTDALIHEHGARLWFDEPRWESMKLPLTTLALESLVDCWTRFLCATSHCPKKVLVCDLDHTLWHGIVGEVGAERLEMGTTEAGHKHHLLQRELRALQQRGILLAICSKNNYDDAWPVIEKHPEMQLRPQHFASVQINWRSKHENLIAIAKELNVGLDALVFLDDNPAERQLVRQLLPQVTVIEVNGDGDVWGAFRKTKCFERLTLSREDLQRGELYIQERQRDDHKATFQNLEEYLHSLQLSVECIDVGNEQIPRTAQLTQSTNQFNLTTRRYTTGDIENLLKDDATKLLLFRAQDRFGDNGLIGLCILRYKQQHCEIDTFLLSCRVIGRGIETAMLARVFREAAARGATKVIGWYFPTDRNAPCAGFYLQHGFVKSSGEESWSAPMELEIQYPSWITIADDCSPCR